MPPPLARFVVLVSRPDPGRRLRPFIRVLEELQIEVVFVETTKEAGTLLFRNRAQPQAIAIDVHHDDPPAYVDQVLGQLRTLLPFLAPVLLTFDAGARAVITAFRAGAGDVIDLAVEQREGIVHAIERAAADYHRRSGKTEQESELRSVLDEFLRDLVHTERRAMDLENELANLEIAEVEPVLDTRRQPVIVIVDSDRQLLDVLTDRLEDSGLVAYSFTNGEEAAREAHSMLTRSEPIDIVVVENDLPGMSGLDTIEAMRTSAPAAPYFLMTARSSAELAAAAADCGVAGYIIKPLEDLAGLVNRLRETALTSQDRTRETGYLERIKERHQSVLQRYRALTIEAELPDETA